MARSDHRAAARAVAVGSGPRAARLEFSIRNPARRSTWLAFRLPAPDDLVVRVHDVAGRERAVHRFTALAAGEHVLPLDLSDLPGGVYAVTIRSGAAGATRKVSLTH